MYQKALNAKALDDASTAATAGLLLNPVGGTAALLNGVSVTTGFGSAYLEGELINEAGEYGLSEVFQVGLESMLGKRTGTRVNTLLDLSGFHDKNTDFIPEDSKLIEDANTLISRDDDESK
ncbi:hypothetical protein [Idiomarina tyrosinivorans]|uniref:hypothetical protein n=1 Tax=Idiomarina tyrosinivorans TaxID=1445662 RepID=UPI000F87043C|nr:hypothetical protein [Idiomarina tyrosinivorans]